MDQVLCEALRSFEFGGRLRTARSAPFWVPERQFNELAANGLVARVPEEVSANPTPAAGAPPSASPAAPVSPETTSSSSADGDSPKEPEKPARKRRRVAG